MPRRSSAQPRPQTTHPSYQLAAVGMVTLVILNLALSGRSGHQAQAQDLTAKSSTGPASRPATTAPASQKTLVTIEGTVTDPAGQPIPQAEVEWGYIYDPPEKLQRTTTDGHGHFRFDLREYGVDYRLIASAPGRAPNWTIPFAGWESSLRDLPRDSDAIPPRTVNLQLESEHRLSGVVVDKQGRRIQGARVTARTASEGFYSSFSSPSPSLRIPGKGTTDTTDADGRFDLSGLPAGRVQLNVQSPHRHVNDTNYPVDQECRIVMSGSGRPGIIRFKVVDVETGKPVRAFTVFRRYDPKPRSFNTPDGRCEWKEDVTEGELYYLYIYSKDHLPAVRQTAALSLDSGEEDAEIAEILAGPSFLGRLIDARSGKPLPGIPVLYGVIDDDKTAYFGWPDRDEYVDGHHQLTRVQRALTDERGQFWFSEYEEEQGTLFILATGYERLILRPSDRPPSAAGDPHIPIKLHPEATITGVLHKAHAAQANPSVSVWKENPRTRPEETFENYPTDAQGKYFIRGLGPGTYQLSYWTSPSRSTAVPKRFATVTLGRSEQKVIEPGRMETSDQPGKR